MTEKELMEGLIAHLLAEDDQQYLDPDGHYAATVVVYCRPDEPDKWAECKTSADRKATVGSVTFSMGCGTKGAPPVEQICAGAAKHLLSAMGESIVRESQQFIREREEKLQ